MRVTVRYENDDDNLVLRFTLTPKHVLGMTFTKLFGMFAKQFEKKFSTSFVLTDHYVRLAASASQKIADMESLISDYCPDDELDLYVLPHGKEARPITESSVSESAARKVNENSEEADSGSGPASQNCPPATTSTGSSNSNGMLRCKNFGCNIMYDPNNNADHNACRHHKAPPIFHETAKWWSCCPNKKAYDWDEFQKIPGCQYGQHCNVAAKKQVLGGVDLREGSAPQRIDGGAELDPRKKLEGLRKAMINVGVSEDYFDRAWGRLSAKHGDLKKVCDIMKGACEEALEKAASGEGNAAPAAGGSGDGLDDME